jgi:hypothetical protein
MTTIAHGETKGWVAGCRERCCREAVYAYNRQRNSEIAIHGDEARRLVDATGTKRRIQSLMLMGYLTAEIATACGWESAQAATNLLARDQVNRETAEKVKTVYRKMWKIWLSGGLNHLLDEPMRKRSIAAAKAKGFLPGAVWEEIDDPKDKPTGLV